MSLPALPRMRSLPAKAMAAMFTVAPCMQVGESLIGVRARSEQYVAHLIVQFLVQVDDRETGMGSEIDIEIEAGDARRLDARRFKDDLRVVTVGGDGALDGQQIVLGAEIPVADIVELEAAAVEREFVIVVAS